MPIASWSIPAEPGLVGPMRERIAVLAAQNGLCPGRLADLRLACTEAMSNAVRHAYPDGAAGPLRVEIRREPGALVVLVRDEGGGLRPRPDSPGMGLGLPLMAQLADTFAVRDLPGRGTEVRLRFGLEPAQARPAAA